MSDDQASLAAWPPKQHRRWDRRRLTVVLGLMVIVSSALGFIGWQQLAADEPDGPPRAVIVDQLGLAAKNPAFINGARATLEEAGYDVDYVPSHEVTVDFYRELPKAGYDVVLLRAHSGLLSVGENPTDGVFLFTSERYDESTYLDEQRNGELAIASIFGVPQSYFGITPAFIESSMEGDFEGATVIVMGCDGLTYDTNAAAFVERGAKVVFGWRGLVTSGRTDTATQLLLSSLLDDRLGASEAVARTMSDVGPDPYFDSQLRYYPAAEEPQTSAD